MRSVVLQPGVKCFTLRWQMLQSVFDTRKKQHTPILKGLNVLVEMRGWEVEVLPLVAGGQGKGVTRVPVDFWDKHRGWEKNHQGG